MDELGRWQWGEGNYTNPLHDKIDHTAIYQEAVRGLKRWDISRHDLPTLRKMLTEREKDPHPICGTGQIEKLEWRIACLEAVRGEEMETFGERKED